MVQIMGEGMCHVQFDVHEEMLYNLGLVVLELWNVDNPNCKVVLAVGPKIGRANLVF